ncbi:unnamed protein product, partial [Heterosigma akashiwo]
MPRELITIQVGQCGNQIGREFWRIALEEHATHNPAGVFDEAMSSFFRNVDTRYGSMPLELPVGDGTTPIGSLRARAVLVDMEDGPMSETLRGPLGELFEESQVIREQTSSGSGNNWAQGYYGYGPQHAAGVVEAVRRSAELCDALQSFFLLHSLGGGTGSGLGTYVLGLLEDSFPEVYRFAASVFPGAGEEDVVTGPYNAALACAELSARADCVLPVDNGALAAAAAAAAGSRGGREGGGEGDGGFGGMNAVAAQMLAHLTSSVRFSGELNVDLNEITTNLVPFPRLQYILAGYSPLGSMSRNCNMMDGVRLAVPAGGGDTRMAPRNLKQMFADIISPSHQLMDVNPKGGWSFPPANHAFISFHMANPHIDRNNVGTVLACAMLLRGDVAISDVTSNIDKLQSQLQMVHWN